MTQLPAEKMKPVEKHSIHGGFQHIYRFDNGYGASVIKHRFSYGLELAVISFKGEDNNSFDLTYNTPITDDVIGNLSDDELLSTLESVKNLPPI